MRIAVAAVAAMQAIRVPSDRDCCVFVESVLRHAFGVVVDDVAPARWRIIRDDPGVPDVGPWSPVQAAVTAGLTVAYHVPNAEPMPIPTRGALDEPWAGRVGADALRPGRWHIVQGWRGEPFAPRVTGHTFLWYAATRQHGTLLDSVSTPLTRPRGPEMRGLLPWAGVVDEFRGGLAFGVLRRPPA